MGPTSSTGHDRWRWLLLEWRPKGCPAWLGWSPKPLLQPSSPWHLRLAIARLIAANLGVAYFAFVVEQPFTALFFLLQVNLAALDVRFELRREHRFRGARR